MYFILLSFPLRLQADFEGSYADSQWTFKAYDGDGMVDWMGDFITLDSGYTGSGTVAQVDLTARAVRSGTVHFNWAFFGDLLTAYRFLWIRNGNATVIAARQEYADGGSSFAVNAGDTFGFRVTAPKDQFSAMVEVSSFFAPGQEPRIFVQPQPQIGCLGDIVTFAVAATNAFEYQWQFKGQNLPGEDFDELDVKAVAPADTGTYRVIVRNPLGSVISQAVPLIVMQPPSITAQPPAAITDFTGQKVIISVSATGTNHHYQWRRDGTNLVGAIGPSLELSNLQLSDAGIYSVAISNECGVVTSTGVALTVKSEVVEMRIVCGANRAVSIEVLGPAGRQYVLETSPNLSTWTPATTNVLVVPGSPLFQDTAERGSRFYRVRPLPE